jgi:4-carboxymuconolactone decarboxylase
MKIFNSYILVTMALLLYSSNTMQAQNNTGRNQGLEPRQQHIVTISSFTAKGDGQRLRKALNEGLDAGLTINECKEVLVHLYAYCGFPRSISGLNTLINVLEERRKAYKIRLGKKLRL